MTTRGKLTTALVLATASSLVAVWFLRPVEHKPPEVHGNCCPLVLVAKQRIPKGTPGSVVAKSRMYTLSTIPLWDGEYGAMEDGAISDPQYLMGRAAIHDILPGQQITVNDFH